MNQLAVCFRINENSENIKNNIIEYLNTILYHQYSKDIYDDFEHLYFNIINNDDFEQIIQFLDNIVYDGQNNVFENSNNPIRFTIDIFESDEITTLQKTKYSCLNYLINFFIYLILSFNILY